MNYYISLPYYILKILGIDDKCMCAFTLSGSAFCFFLSVSVFFTSFITNVVREENVMFQCNIF